jgi:Asp-tRNA(Asn)/Glu-tRNA(Gln) amidotransferase C subunit
LQDKKPLLRNVMREDLVTNTPREFTEDILSNSPKRKDDYIEVKNIL